MIKVPRYMKEYAGSIKKACTESKKRLGHVNDDMWNGIIEQVNKTVTYYQNGLITEGEAMRTLAGLPY